MTLVWIMTGWISLSALLALAGGKFIATAHRMEQSTNTSICNHEYKGQQ
ncbi:hypothetical protein [Glutamicibacter ardleyensis]